MEPTLTTFTHVPTPTPPPTYNLAFEEISGETLAAIAYGLHALRMIAPTDSRVHKALGNVNFTRLWEQIPIKSDDLYSYGYGSTKTAQINLK